MKKRWMIWAGMAVVMFTWMAGAAGAQEQKQEGPLRVVIAGMVHGHVDGFLSEAAKRKDLEIVGVWETDRALFDGYAKKFGLEAKLYHADLKEALTSTKPEAVLIYTNTFEHRKTVEISADYSKAHAPKPLTVMMEKPLAVSVADAHAIVSTATAAKMTVLVNYWTLWEANRRGAYELVNSGDIGEVRKVVAHDGHKGPKEIGVGPEFLGWLTDPKLNGGGALYDFGCYGADFMTWLMKGERPLTVTAVTQTIKPDVYPKVEDEATIVLTYPKAQAILQASWNWPFGKGDVEIYGKTGTVFTKGGKELEIRLEGQKEAKDVQANPLPEPLNDEITYLKAVVRDGYKPEGPGSLEVNVVVAEILDAARESAKTGKTVKLK
ncbi:MAG TPA: Gfo/Idh/MocA family oxidoreductase [Dongiaceae bacterium]|nr:Gfo/Idh/MocA family oxidoreductase [Dongiaceae bacterium]